MSENTALWPDNASSTTLRDDSRRASSYDETPRETVAVSELDKKATRGPFWLSKTALAGFCLLFIACAASLVALDRLMAALDGLPLTISSSSYSWTYGPTAILVVILSFWRRIDYYYKSSQPWRELWAGPAPADRSVLLDYITPFQGTSLVRAMKNGHYSVAATIFSFFLLKLVILISTTLFVVTPTLRPEFVAIQYRNRFDAALEWDHVHYLSVQYRMADAFDSGSDTAVWAYLAKLNNATTNDTRWNVPNNLATQSFGIRAAKGNATSLEAPVDIFVPRISCEPATPSALEIPNLSFKYHQYKLNFKSATCSASGDIITPCYNQGNPENPVLRTSDDCPKVPRTYTLFRLNCSLGLDKETDDFQDWVYGSWQGNFEPYDIRYAVTATRHEVQTSKDKDGGESETLTDDFEFSSIICKIGYAIVSANATLNLLTGDVSLPKGALDGEVKMMRNLSDTALAEMLLFNLGQSTSLVLNTTLQTTRVVNLMSQPGPPLFQLMFAKLEYPADLDVFHQPSVLEDTFVSVMGGIATEFARQSLLVTNTSAGLAEGLISEDRLHARGVALWAMVADFCLLSVICMILLLMNRRSPGPWIPAMSGSIAGHGAILANSPPVKDALKDTGHFGEKKLKQRLEGTQFTAGRDPVQGVFLNMTGPISDSGDIGPSVQMHEKTKGPWIPLAARLPMITVTFIVPIIAIGILELLQRLSDQKHGLVNLSQGDSTVSSYVVRVTSTLTVFAMATMFNNLDFTIVTFALIAACDEDVPQADTSILFHLLSVSPFLVLLKSMRRRHFGAAASNFSSLIGGFLTVIVSGLWVVTSPTGVHHSSDALINHWDRSWLDNPEPPDDGGAGLRLNSILRNGTTNPPGIWEDVVVPKLSLPSPDDVSPGADYTYDVLSLQPQLNCTVVPQERITSEGYMRDYNGTLLPRVRVTVDPIIPLECSKSSVNGRGNLSYTMDEGGSTIWALGSYFDLVNSTAGKVSTACPSVGIIFGLLGNFAGKEETFDRDITALLCSQTIREVPLTVTYKGDPASGEISSDQPPVLSPTRAQGLRNGPNGTYTLGIRLRRFFDSQLFRFGLGTTMETFKKARTGATYDLFFNFLLSGPGGRPHEDFEGSQNAGKLARAVESLHNEYMRQIIDLNLRAGSDSPRDSLVSAADAASFAMPSAANTAIVGTVSEMITHLAVHKTSKLILQFLLAAMTVFSFVGYALVKLRGTLPRDPCSIASTMSFLAGSQLCDRDAGAIPQRAEFMSDQQLKRAFDGRYLALGGGRLGGLLLKQRPC